MSSRCERGQATVEYVGVALLVAALLSAVMVAANPSDLGDAVVSKLRCTLGDACESEAPTRSAEATLDPALRAWVLADYERDPVLQGGRALGRSKAGRSLARASSFGEVLACGAAIAITVASGAVPAWRLYRLVQFVRSVGGVRVAAQLLTRATTRAEKLAELAKWGVAVPQAILGIDDIVEKC